MNITCNLHKQNKKKKKKQEKDIVDKATLDINKPSKILLCLCVRSYTYKGHLSTVQGWYRGTNRGTKDGNLEPNHKFLPNFHMILWQLATYPMPRCLVCVCHHKKYEECPLGILLRIRIPLRTLLSNQSHFPTHLFQDWEIERKDRTKETFKCQISEVILNHVEFRFYLLGIRDHSSSLVRGM